MKFRVEVVCLDGSSQEQRHTVLTMERAELAMETLGMSLSEGKAMLSGVQDVVIAQQARDYLEQRRACPDCGRLYTSKDAGTTAVKTVFGSVPVANPRWNCCTCQSAGPRTFRPMRQWLRERTSPEMLYLETKWASLIPFAKVAALLCDVLPVDDSVNARRSELIYRPNAWKKSWARNGKAAYSKDRKRNGSNSLCRMAQSRWAWMADTCGLRTSRAGSR